MMIRKKLSTYILKTAISLTACLLMTVNMQAQNGKRNIKMPPKQEKRDSIPLFNGFAVSVDLVGPAMKALGDYGQYEAALRLNMRNKYFPIVELGYGSADGTDLATNIHYTTHAPYFKVGMDFNILRNKRSSNHLFLGFRYAYTSYKDNVSLNGLKDPVWQNEVNYGFSDNQCYYHWMEVVFGIDAKIWGPIHLGWSVRYRQRITCDEGTVGKSWYVPGYGTSDTSKLGGTFNLTFDI